MTPTTVDLLTGNLIALSTPPPPEAAGDYGAGMVGITGKIGILAAQEAEMGAAARVAENAAIREVLGQPAQAEPDLTISALDAVNAELRRALIAAHAAAEEAGEDEAKYLALYRRMAQLRRLELPSLPGV